jgi:hypothetical protein
VPGDVGQAPRCSFFPQESVAGRVKQQGPGRHAQLIRADLIAEQETRLREVFEE